MAPIAIEIRHRPNKGKPHKKGHHRILGMAIADENSASLRNSNRGRIGGVVNEREKKTGAILTGKNQNEKKDGRTAAERAGHWIHQE